MFGARVVLLGCGTWCLLGSVGVLRTAWQGSFVRVHVELTKQQELFACDSHVALSTMHRIVSHTRQVLTNVNLMASLDDVHPDTKMHTHGKRVSDL